MSNINDSYFDGYYKEIWRNIIPEILTEREIAFILSYFSLKPGDKVLDLMCGYGRHSIALAEKGIEVTAIDNLLAYTNEIEKTAREKYLPVKVITGSVLQLEEKVKAEVESKSGFDLTICMGNSLNFFNPVELDNLLKQVSHTLKPGGHFLVNSWSIAEIAFRNFKERTEQNMGGYLFITEAKKLSDPNRMEIVTTMIPQAGQSETKTAVDYVYSINELTELFKKSGLSLVEVFSIPGKKKFTEGEPRAYLVVKKI